MGGGRRRNRRIGSIRSIWSRCWSSSPRRCRALRYLNRIKVLGFTQTADAVTAEAQDLDSGETLLITADYLIGCDGPSSEIRRQIGARLTGDAMISRTQSTYIRAPSLTRMMQAAPAWSTQSLNPRRSANMFAVDGRETWLIHNYLRPDETDFAAVDRDRCIRLILGVGPEFEYEILSQEDWIGRRMLADRFRDRRVFICGDAAHIWVPFAGYGMNAGIADAMNLSWMLAGVLQGWAAPAILEAYEAERRPITEQVSHYAMNTAMALARARAEVPANIEDAGPEGDAVRERFGRAMYELHMPQFCCGGLNFGYFYDRSPIIAYDGETAPPYTMYDFTPSTVPGCRTPHVWLRDGRSLYDAMGAGFTLLRFDRSVSVDAMAGAAAEARRAAHGAGRGLDEARSPYTHKLVLSRPDQHVAWRGNRAARRCRLALDRPGSVARATLPATSTAKCGATFCMNSVRLCATSSYDIGPSRNCMITPPTPIASTCASFSATVAGEP